jgi:hypothetical protein
MRAVIPPIPQYAFMSWFLIKHKIRVHCVVISYLPTLFQLQMFYSRDEYLEPKITGIYIVTYILLARVQ